MHHWKVFAPVVLALATVGTLQASARPDDSTFVPGFGLTERTPAEFGRLPAPPQFAGREAVDATAAALAPPVSGARYISTYQAATSFARSISGRYHTSITRSGRLHCVSYWARGSHG